MIGPLVTWQRPRRRGRTPLPRGQRIALAFLAFAALAIAQGLARGLFR